VPPGCYPLLLVLFTLKRLIFPLKVRIPLWHAVFSAITAPFTKPTFFYTYIADVFCSMVKVFQDILWTGCFFVSGDFLIFERDDGVDNVEPKNWHTKIWYKNIVIPLICLFPLWIRFNQCLRRYIDTGKRNPNLFNAAKYALSQMVTLFGAFHPLYMMHVERKADKNHDDVVVEIAESGGGIFDYFWMGIFIASSLYSYFWDVRMDWGLGRLNNRLLGTRLMFPQQKAYYVVMVADLFLR
jgi:xenotropic and polytropic retrovirus receptor 1